MAWTQAQLDAIRKAYASGVTRVAYDGKMTEYRSLAEMRTIISEIETDLADQAGLKRRPVAGFAGFRRR